jgi:PAS domain S-box-containing protein
MDERTDLVLLLRQEVESLRRKLEESREAEAAHRKALEALQASEERYRRLLEGNADGIYLGQGSRYLYANQRLLDMLGYAWEELREIDVWDTIAPESRQHLRERDAKKLRGEPVPEEYALKLLRKDGAELEVETRVRIYVRDGQRFFHGCARDITERRRSEAERERLIRDLRQAVAQIRTLHGLIPICASCKKIRDDRGYWHQVEVYLRDHAGADFSHGLCPDCAVRLYPEVLARREGSSRETS